MSKYFASVALLCAFLVAAPAKADVLSELGFDPELYDLAPVLIYSWDGAGGVRVDGIASAWGVNVDEKSMDLSELGMGVMTVPGMTASLLDPSKLANYDAFFIGYGGSSVYDPFSASTVSWLGLSAILSTLDLDSLGDDVKAVLGMLPPFVPVSEVPYGSLGPMLEGFGVAWSSTEDDAFGYLYLPDLTGALKGGGDMSIDFFFNDVFLGGEGAPAFDFQFGLYGVVAKGTGEGTVALYPAVGGGEVPEPATLALVGLGLAGLGLARRRMK